MTLSFEWSYFWVLLWGFHKLKKLEPPRSRLVQYNKMKKVAEPQKKTAQ